VDSRLVRGPGLPQMWLPHRRRGPALTLPSVARPHGRHGPPPRKGSETPVSATNPETTTSMKRQWQFTLIPLVLDSPSRTTQHTYTVHSPQALNPLVQRPSKDRYAAAYNVERVDNGHYRWRPCDCHAHLATKHGVIGEHGRRQHRIVVNEPRA